MILFALLPLCALFLLWAFISARHPKSKTDGGLWQDSLIKAGLGWSVFFVLGTELLSLFRAIATLSIVLLWLFGIIVLLFFLWRSQSFTVGVERIKQSLTLPKNCFDMICFAVIAAILIILFITGIMSPPAIHDVLTYHMTRVMHWVQNHSLSFYPTHISWQLWHPPFAEITQLHWQLLTQSDILSFFTQWINLILTLITVGAIARKSGAKQRGMWLSALFFTSLPIVLLQTSGAKNDLVLAFFFAALAYFAVKAADRKLRWFDWIATGAAVGLGVLTKGSFAFFALPLLIWIAVSTLSKAGWKKTALFALVGLTILSLLNVGHWVRNAGTFDSPLGTSSADYLMNDRFGIDVVISNLSKNMAVQLMSVGFMNNIIERLLVQLHDWMGISMFEQAITHGPTEFFDIPSREEVASNPLHFIITGFLSIVVIVCLISKKGHNKCWTSFILSLAAISGMALFSGIFRWQVWGTRYFIPYYILFAPVAGFVFGRRLPELAGWGLAGVLVILAVYPLFNNYSRSFSWSEENRNSIWRKSRKSLRFANHQAYEGGILELTYAMNVSGCRSYGLILVYNSPEYLIWGTLEPKVTDYHLVHMAVENQSSKHYDEGFQPCGIIVFEAAEPAWLAASNYEIAGRWDNQPQGGQWLSLYLLPEYLPRPAD